MSDNQKPPPPPPPPHSSLQTPRYEIVEKASKSKGEQRTR